MNECNGCEYAECMTGGIYCNLRGLLVPYGYEGCMAYDDWHEMYFVWEEE